MLDDVSLIAHRGASAYAPENTFAAFEKARLMGATWLEFDVMLSADGEAFVFHDDLLDRTSNGKGPLAAANSSALGMLDAGAWFSKQFVGQRIPKFCDLLDWLSAHDMNANIEIKPSEGQAEATTRAVIKALEQHWPKTKAPPLISSFNHEALQYCRRLHPELPIGLLLYGWDDDCLNKAQSLRCCSIHIDAASLTKARALQIKDNNYLLLVYTVNNPRLAKKLFSWGVDAVFSDYPELC